LNVVKPFVEIVLVFVLKILFAVHIKIDWQLNGKSHAGSNAKKFHLCCEIVAVLRSIDPQ